jgi:hypothetical protein
MILVILFCLFAAPGSGAILPLIVDKKRVCDFLNKPTLAILKSAKLLTNEGFLS